MAQQTDPTWDVATNSVLCFGLPTDDFADFLELSNPYGGFNYPIFEGHNGNVQDVGQYGIEMAEPASMHDHDRHQASAEAYPAFAGNGTYAHKLYEPDMPTNQDMPSNDFVQSSHAAPPTPNSAPMYAKSPSYYHSHRDLSHNGPNISAAPAPMPNALSPFISPELESCASAVSHTPEYAGSGVYNLSPLTSPAMQPHMSVTSNYSATGTGSLTPSPNMAAWVKPDLPIISDEARPQKARKKASAKPPKSSTPSHPRKVPTSAPSRTVSLSLKTTPNGPGLSKPALRNGSTSNSISPRPLNEVLMGPPPKPVTTSTSSTPTHRGQVADAPSLNPPATPTSVMGFRAQPASPANNAADSFPKGVDTLKHDETRLDHLELPEAAAPLSGAIAHDSARSILRIRGHSPGSPDHRGQQKKGNLTSSKEPSSPQKVKASAVQTSRKRNSNGSTLVSPALRPKLSPNVKPLLPEGANVESETHALLLASRSNYENILSGSHLPGIRYPADLGANLTSKRTSHKLAEQGRRNRINVALQEMHTLLPANFTDTLAACKDLHEADANGAANKSASRTNATPTQSGNSKAATVECAIEYIRHLQHQVQSRDAAIDELKHRAGNE